jgi:Polysaccharide deacetylase
MQMFQKMRKFFSNRHVLLIGALLIAGCSGWLLAPHKTPGQAPTIALLVPDLADPHVADIWKQAASEEGVMLEVVTASAFLRPAEGAQKNYVGVIVPDTIHRRANNFLTDALREYVRRGGKLMLVFDALTLDLDGAYAQSRSRLSDVAGVDYAMYKKYGDGTMGLGIVAASQETVAAIGVTPGRYLVERPISAGTHIFDRWLTTYHYDALLYSYFKTERQDASTDPLMLSAEHDLVAGSHAFGKGTALFVNLPLGYLKTRTDGLLLHSFLRHFSDDIVGLPRLMAAPQGVGGMILNIHVDSGAAIKSMDYLERLGVFSQGPYSIHFTAGPDVTVPGDGKGMDVEHNPETQGWIRKLAAQGNTIGNHGGWIHNYFSGHVNEDNRAEFEKYLTLNNDALSKVVGKPLLEYAAPEGNHPAWTTDWLEEHHMLASYTTANGGMGTTRIFHADGKVDKRLWFMPVASFGHIASFEEAMFRGTPHQVVTAWLQDVAHYVADSGNIRLIYCHPPGVQFYSDSVTAMLDTTQKLQKTHTFKWYTMTDVANFMSRREDVSWHVEQIKGQLRIQAEHPKTLADMTWRVAKSTCAVPQITEGKGMIKDASGVWEIVGGDTKKLGVSCR